MKLRGREINIFSMSVLDLFASGMGAFILLAIMALPFFPNTGRSPAQADSAGRALETAQRERDEAQRRVEELVKALEDAKQEHERVTEWKVPEFDLVICLDVSGSMSRHIEGLKLQINNLALILNSLAPAGFGVVAFGDRYWDRPIFSLDITTDMDVLKAFVGGLAPNMGSGWERNLDRPEALALGLEHAVAMNWRSVSERRYIVVISDQPAYPERQAAALQVASEFAAMEGNHISAVMVNGWGTGRAAEPFMRQLTATGNGEFVDGDEKTLIGSILLAVLLS